MASSGVLPDRRPARRARLRPRGALAVRAVLDGQVYQQFPDVRSRRATACSQTGEKVLIKSGFHVSAVWLTMLFHGLLLMAAGVAAAVEGNVPEEHRYSEVRVDLQAGTFLDPLPFDQPFVVVGPVPPSTVMVEVRLSEYLEEPLVPSSPQLQHFEANLADYLQQALSPDALHADDDGAYVLQVRRTLNQLLVEAVQTGRRRPMLARVGHYVPPWNWNNWADLFLDRRYLVVAPGTIFDLDADSGASAFERLIAEKGHSPQAVAIRVAAEARSARVAAYCESRPAWPVLRWNRLAAAGDTPLRTSALAAQPLEAWNRLDRIHTLSGISVLERSPVPGFVQPSARGIEEAWGAFRVLVPPLQAGRYYHFEFDLERTLTKSEVTAFVDRARRRSDEVLAAAERPLSQADGQRLHLALTQTLQATLSTAWHASPGTLFDPEMSYARVRAPMLSLAEHWRRAADADKQGETLERLVEDMIRPQQLAHQTSIGASTKANNYISADVGLLHAGVIGKTVAYAGANFYLWPVNKGAPLRQHGGFGRRFAFTVGLTLQSIEDTAGIRRDLLFNQALVVGAGYRISQYWRLGGGGLVFRERVPDAYPLTRRRRTALTPYVALSFDADIGQQLKGMGRLFDFLKNGR